MTDTKKQNFDILAQKIRIAIMRELTSLGFGHVGGAMSMADLLGVLYGGVMNVRPEDPRWEERDWLVVSKGHAGPAVYAALALRGFFPMDILDTLNRPGTTLPSHCDRNRTPGVDMTTGSLGQGISTAIGAALGNRLMGRKSTVYLVVGDGECDEGQIWEGILFSAHHKVDNLIMFIDYNKKQLDGYTDDICKLGSLGKKLEAFGWFAQEVDGHDTGAIYHAIQNAKASSGAPCAIVLHTVKGKGCSMAESSESNHHMSFTREEGAKETAQMQIILDKLEKGENV